MAELTLRSKEDVKKLEGWTIKAVSIREGLGVGCRLTITHPLAGCPVELSFFPRIQFGKGVNDTMQVTPALTLEVKDVALGEGEYNANP